ncbi:MAG: hypothetical protein QMD22_09185 [archaeon]|nr:hypothetical protein [archaeon]
MKLADEVKVALVTAVCILGLAVLSKYVINVELDFISQYGPVWMFMVYVITKEKAKKSKICCTTLFWSLTIILVTVAILVIYAI